MEFVCGDVVNVGSSDFVRFIVEVCHDNGLFGNGLRDVVSGDCFLVCGFNAASNFAKG